MENRDIAAARHYHDLTKHSTVSVRQGPHFLDWDNMPRPFKVYTGLEPIPLPRDWADSTRPALQAIADAGSSEGDEPRLNLAALARLLHFSAGVIRHRAYPGGEVFFRAAACTGALYHIDLYVVCGDLDDLEAGVYHFGPHDFALRRLRAGDYRGVVADATAGEAAVATAPATVICTSTFWRNAWKYRARTYRHCFWDNGTLLANLLALGAAVNLPMQVVLGFVDAEVNGLLGLDENREVALSLVPVGRGGAPVPTPPLVSPLHLETLPLSAHEVDYPPIREMHQASSLAAADEVAAWRERALDKPVPTADGTLALEPAAPIERVIERRGSTRVFRREPIGRDALAAILHAATRGIPADFTAPGAALADIYAIANAVDGLEPGTYAFDRRRDALLPLHAGDCRRDAGLLDLGQELAADAAVNLYWLNDLTPVLERLGNRGYRTAQMQAAIEAGKTYLASYALGLGATGLTFFDDDVTEFFSPHAAGKSVLFLMAIGLPATRPRRPRH